MVGEIAAGAGVTCATFAGSSVRCAGNNDRGTLGDGSAMSLDAVPVALPSGTAVAACQAAVVMRTASALLSDGSVLAWGAIPSVLGAPGGPPERTASPVVVAAPPAQAAAAQEFVTDAFACLLAANGGVHCLETNTNAGTPLRFDVVPGLESGALDLESNCAAPASGSSRHVHRRRVALSRGSHDGRRKKCRRP